MVGSSASLGASQQRIAARVCVTRVWLQQPVHMWHAPASSRYASKYKRTRLRLSFLAAAMTDRGTAAPPGQTAVRRGAAAAAHPCLGLREPSERVPAVLSATG